MASAKAIALMESIYSRVDTQVRAILATLPGVTVPAQQDGAVISAQRRIFNFEGPGVVVTDDPARHRVNVFIPGSPTTGTASVFISTPGLEKTFPYGTAPANWQTNAFSDTGWSNSVLESTSLTSFFVPVPTASWITDTTLNGTAPVDSQFLARRTFTLPAGSIVSATLEINFDDNLGTTAGGIGPPDDLFINEHRMDVVIRTGSPLSYGTLVIPIAWLIAGADNVLAVNVFSQAGATALSYRITVNMSEAGVDPLYQLLSEKDQDLGYAGLDADGLVSDAALADSGTANSTTFLRGDRSWSAASTNAITIAEIDAAPTVTATTLQFPNNTLTDQGGGVARYTPAAPTALPYANLQDQKSSGTDGGTFTAAAWQTRVINTEQADSAAIASIASNQITLAAGTYRCYISCPAGFVASHQARLRNVTAATTLVTGTSENVDAVGLALNITKSIISGEFTVAGSQALEIQHFCDTTRATNGFGAATGFGTEVYTVAEFWKVS